MHLFELVLNNSPPQIFAKANRLVGVCSRPRIKKEDFRVGIVRAFLAKRQLAWLSIIGLLAGLLTVTGFGSSAASAASADCSATMTAQNGLTATPSHGSVFYIDSSVTPKVDSAYVAYKINNSSATARTNVWLQLSSFVGGKVLLANPSDSSQQISIPANGTATAFFLLKANGASTLAQSHVVQLFDSRPDLAGASSLLSCNFGFKKVAETIKASANKITTVTGALSPSTATLGGTYTITVKGETGKIGSGSTPDMKAFWASPSAYSSWPTRSLRLVNTQIQLCTGAQYNSNPAVTLTNQLLYNPASFPTCLGNNGDTWIGTYTFRIIGPGPSSLTPSPVAIISSGTQYKHSDVNGIASNTSVNLSGVSNTNIAVNVTASSTIVASTSSSVTIRYLAAISTNSTTALSVDELVDTHDGGATLVSGSVKTGTNLASLTTSADPSFLAADAGKTPPPYHFVGPYSTVSGSPYYIQYDFVIPCTSTTETYTTKVVAYTGDVMIGASATTISTSNVTTSTSAGCANPTIQSTTTSMSPSAVTNPASSIAATSATLNGYAYPTGQTGVQYQFAYSTDPNLVNGVSLTALTSATGSAAVTATSAITGLTASTVYYFRTIVKDGSGNYYYGSTLSFQTLAQQAVPSVVTGAVTGLSAGNATLNGTTNPNLTAVSGVFFRLCANAALTTSCATNTFVQVDDGTGAATNLTFTSASSGDFAVTSDGITGTQRVTGLTVGTTYYYRLSVTCPVVAVYCATGQVDGAVRSFTYGAPSTTTEVATLVGSTTATLNGFVNANSTTAAATLCYSQTNSVTNGVLGSVTCVTASPSSISGSTETAIQAAITGLTPGTTYYFQAKAVVTTPSYTSYGSVLSFVTLAQTTSNPLPAGQVGSPYTASIAGIGGSGSYNWSTASTLPQGLAISPSGLISGTPTEGGSFSIVVRMIDSSNGEYVDVTYTLVVGVSVTFHSNFVGGASDVIQVGSGSTALQANSFVRTGYDFAGWATTSGGSLAYADTANYAFTSSTELFAIWTPKSYVITYDRNDASSTTDTQSLSYGDTSALSFVNPWTRTGQTFIGWATAPEATSAASSYTVTGNATLYAVWEAETYTITFSKNDGSATTTSGSFAYGSSDALSFVNPWTWSGYTFVGWSVSSSATSADSNYTVTGPATLYAIWELVPANSVVITYSKNDGSGATQQDSFVVGDTTALSQPNNWSRTGYTFLGWATTAGATAAATSYTVTTEATLFAVWQVNTYTITYRSNDGLSNTASEVKPYGSTDALAYVNPWNRTGYTFLGWATTAGATSAATSYTVTADANLYAVWQLNSYTITYDKNSGTNTTVDKPYDHFATDALNFGNPWSRTGYTFLGWATTAGATSAATSYTVIDNAVLYAVWQINSYTITYDKNQGLTANQNYNFGATNALDFANPWTRAGYTFVGWSINQYANLADTSFVVTSNETLFAVWQVSTAATAGGFPNQVKSITLGQYTLVTPTTNSPGTITYSASCVGVATVSGNKVTFLAAGVCQITATIAAAPGFGETTISMTLTITPAVVYVPVTPTTGNTPTITPDPDATIKVEYKTPEGKVTVASTNSTDPNENWSLALRGIDPSGKTTPLNNKKQLEFVPGSKAAASGTGFMPGTTVLLFIGTSSLGTASVGANGTFTTARLIPQSLTSGFLLLQVNGVTVDNGLRSVSVPVVFKRLTTGVLNKSVYFLGDSPKVTGQGGRILQDIWSQLKGKKNIVVTVSGWVKETADKSYDLRLSMQRAQNMVHVLRDIYRIKATYSFRGFGISPENTEKSRRADISVTYSNK